MLLDVLVEVITRRFEHLHGGVDVLGLRRLVLVLHGGRVDAAPHDLGEQLVAFLGYELRLLVLRREVVDEGVHLVGCGGCEAACCVLDRAGAACEAVGVVDRCMVAVYPRAALGGCQHIEGVVDERFGGVYRLGGLVLDADYVAVNEVLAERHGFLCGRMGVLRGLDGVETIEHELLRGVPHEVAGIAHTACKARTEVVALGCRLVSAFSELGQRDIDHFLCDLDRCIVQIDAVSLKNLDKGVHRSVVCGHKRVQLVLRQLGKLLLRYAKRLECAHEVVDALPVFAQDGPCKILRGHPLGHGVGILVGSSGEERVLFLGCGHRASYGVVVPLGFL